MKIEPFNRIHHLLNTFLGIPKKSTIWKTYTFFTEKKKYILHLQHNKSQSHSIHEIALAAAAVVAIVVVVDVDVVKL